MGELGVVRSRLRVCGYQEGTVKRYMPLVLVALLAVVAAQASADNLLINGSFEDGTFSHWTLGTTSNGSAGDGFPIVAPWPLDNNINSWKGEVGEVNFTGLYEGATLSQTFDSTYTLATLSFQYVAMGAGGTNQDGGDFRLILDGTVLQDFDVGTIDPNQIISGSLSADVDLSAGTHTFEIDVLRRYLTSPGATPYQFVTGADVEPYILPEPGSLVLMGSGVLGLAGVLRRKFGV